MRFEKQAVENGVIFVWVPIDLYCMPEKKEIIETFRIDSFMFILFFPLFLQNKLDFQSIIISRIFFLYDQKSAWVQVGHL